MLTEAETNRLAQILWDYHLLKQPPQKSDFIFILGSYDLRVADHAARLYHQALAPLVIVSGGYGRITRDLSTRTEAECLGERLITCGVPESAILQEPSATNTGENIRFTQALLKTHGLTANSFILIQKPYMERRTYATFQVQWPGPRFTVSSPPLSYHDYPTPDRPREELIHMLVGDTQRIREYPKRGFMIPQEIPPEVWAAYEALVAAGYTQQLISD
jgi:uncharacterized SAM-binding protein YcdF (DUF218 family)